MSASAQDHGALLAALLPPGKAWPRQRGSVLTALLEALGATGARIDARALKLLEETDPRTTGELLTDFERVLGLPDDCIGPIDDVGGRRGAVIGRLIQGGGQTPAFFVQVAAALGYTIQVREFEPFGVGSRAGEAIYNPGRVFRAGDSGPGDSVDNRLDWLFAWAVETGGLTITYIRASAFGPGDHLASWGNALLECTLERLKPAHTLLFFRYGVTLTPDAAAALARALDVAPPFLLGEDEEEE